MKIISIFILSFLMLTSCEQVQPPSTEAIIEKAIEAYGGEENLRNITSKHEIGTTIIYIEDTIFRTSRYQQYFKSPGKTYYESPINRQQVSKKLVFASNGEYSWTQNDGALAPYLQPKEEVIERNGEDYPYLFTLKERGVAVEYIRTENNTHLLRYTSENGFIEDVYFDVSTGLIDKTFKEIKTSIGPAEVIQTFNDYRRVGDVMIPFRVESKYPPRESNLNIINSLSINQEIDDLIFEFPQPPNLSNEEKIALSGIYAGGSTKLEIIHNSGDLSVKLNSSQALNLQTVKKDFFMFRIGKQEKSHVENIRKIDDLTIILSYKDKVEKLTKL